MISMGGLMEVRGGMTSQRSPSWLLGGSGLNSGLWVSQLTLLTTCCTSSLTSNCSSYHSHFPVLPYLALSPPFN